VYSWIEPRALCELASETIEGVLASVWLVDAAALPRSAGALDRAALRLQLDRGGLDWSARITAAGFEAREAAAPAHAAWSGTALALSELAAALLQLPALDPSAQLFAQGVDSVACVRLVSHVRERFGVDRLRDVTGAAVHERVEEFRRITSFETAVPVEEHV